MSKHSREVRNCIGQREVPEGSSQSDFSVQSLNCPVPGSVPCDRKIDINI